MRRAVSLQRRLGLGLALGVSALWLAAMLAAGLVIRHEFDEAFDSALQEIAQRLLPLAAIDIMGRENQLAEALVAPLAEHEEFLTYLVRDEEGRILLRSHGADPELFPETPSPGFHETATHRLYGESAISGTITIEVAEPLEHRREATWEAVSALLVPLVVLVPLSLLGALWLVRASLRPLRSFTGEIENRGAADLSPVPVEGVPAEIAPVAEAVNRLINRLRRVLEAERSFSANSAHELRTPVAAALAQTQRLIAEAPEGPLRQRAARIEAQLHRLARLSEKLMQLARAEGGGLVSEVPHDLVPVLAHLVEEMEGTPDGRGRIRLSPPSQGGLLSHLDPDAFAILMRNLMENALRHGKPGGRAEVGVSDRAVRVANEGAVVSPETIAAIKGRFARGTTAATGSGLGLAIADAIAAGSGGSLELRSPASGMADGFEAIFRLPDGAAERQNEEVGA
ncbi:ATP-binding protein [Lutibaculum baratangense]|uniref:histidine kinase n=1 Tax=Lutibaculum baratangense AMV1 TaxID=631454 RepID=V4RL71_9HYPH|nr:ATP-binding protein [Lutibaculum baratangense]ESR23965.1 integral membrane sensor signal transduction histidine kinase [Lutibaculum baratangense AMV1]